MGLGNRLATERRGLTGLSVKVSLHVQRWDERKQVRKMHSQCAFYSIRDGGGSKVVKSVGIPEGLEIMS